MTLVTVHLFNQVGITRDYSAVHDMTPAQWLSYLLGDDPEKQSNRLTLENVNYNRVQDTLRLELEYDTARKFSYGCLEFQSTGMRPMFFWVDGCRLMKKNSREFDNESVVPLDVVELTVSEDVWSNNYGEFELHDTYVERRHMKRWGMDDEPIYYPDGSQGTDGSYRMVKKEMLSPEYTMGLRKGSLRFIVICGVNKYGWLKYIIGCDYVGINSKTPQPVYQKDSQSTSASHPYYSLDDVLRGKIFSEDAALSMTVDSVQGIYVITGLNCVDTLEYNNDRYELKLNDEFRVIDHAGIKRKVIEPDATGVPSATEDPTYADLEGGMFGTLLKKITSLRPEKQNGPLYDVRDEPMMFRAPAMLRKVATGMGSTVYDVPDISAFEEDYVIQPVFEMSSGTLIVYGGTNDYGSLIDANAKGNAGSTGIPTLPIFSTAWATYSAIAKTGDDLLYNAKQTATVIGGVAGVATSAATAAIPGVGAAVGVLSGGSNVVSAATSYWMNEKELEAKRTTIRNSPCNVTDKGAGIAAFVKRWSDLYFLTLKLDDVSYSKLEEQYYFYGYFVNKTMRGKLELRTRNKFDFIKTSRARVRGRCNTDALQTISQIFDAGVTIYHGAEGYEYIGKGMTLSNNEVESDE